MVFFNYEKIVARKIKEEFDIDIYDTDVIANIDVELVEYDDGLTSNSITITTGMVFLSWTYPNLPHNKKLTDYRFFIFDAFTDETPLCVVLDEGNSTSDNPCPEHWSDVIDIDKDYWHGYRAIDAFREECRRTQELIKSGALSNTSDT